MHTYRFVSDFTSTTPLTPEKQTQLKDLLIAAVAWAARSIPAQKHSFSEIPQVYAAIPGALSANTVRRMAGPDKHIVYHVGVDLADMFGKSQEELHDFIGATSCIPIAEMDLTPVDVSAETGNIVFKVEGYLLS